MVKGYSLFTLGELEALLHTFAELLFCVCGNEKRNGGKTDK